MLSHVDKSERLAQRKRCEHCGEWLMTKSGIYYHDKIHTSGIQKCDQCQQELPHKLALMAHIRKHHREPKHKCSHCAKTFEIGSKLRVIIEILQIDLINVNLFEFVLLIFYLYYLIHRSTKIVILVTIYIHVIIV